jgi:hypothetical protein
MSFDVLASERDPAIELGLDISGVASGGVVASSWGIVSGFRGSPARRLPPMCLQRSYFPDLSVVS